MNLKSLVFNNISRNLISNNVALFYQTRKLSNLNTPATVTKKQCLFINQNISFPNIISRRFKSENKKPGKKDESSDEEDEGEDSLDNSGAGRDSKIVTSMIKTMRADAIFKAIQKSSRSKIDTMFYEGRLRVNGKLLLKKSAHINVGDEMDVIKGLSSQNKDFLNISRIEVLKVEADEDEIALKARFYKNLLVENYLDHPWSPEMKVKEEEETAKKSK